MTSKMPYTTPNSNLHISLAERDGLRRSKTKRLARAAAISASARNDLSPKLELVARDPCALIMPARNVRNVEAGHVRRVADAISTFGFVSPALINADGHLIDGVVRVEAAKLLNMSTVPCVIVDALTKSEIKLLRIATNRLGENGGWHLDDLRLELNELIIEDAPIEVTGFELAELDGILGVVEPPVVEPGPIIADAGKAPVARLGDIFVMGRHRVICGDARDAIVLQRLMLGEMARMVFTDQPYNVRVAGHVTGGDHREFAMASGEMTLSEFGAFNEAWISQAVRHLVDGGVLATFIDWRGLASVTQAAATASLSQINLVVWNKTNAGMGSLYRSHHELLPMFKNGNASYVNNIDLGRKGGRARTNVWTYAGASSMGSDARRGLQNHPTVKPVAMLVDALFDLTHRDEIVLDPFLGSGSTLIAAEKSGRVCLGVEIDPLYVDLIARRYQEVTGAAVVLEETGEGFSVLETRRALEKEISSLMPAAPQFSSQSEPQNTQALPAREFRRRTRGRAAA